MVLGHMYTMKYSTKTFNPTILLKTFGFFTICLASLLTLSSCGIERRLDGRKFHFEDYENKTAKETVEALLTLHPFGSDHRELEKTLELAGCKFQDKTYQQKFPEQLEHLNKNYKLSGQLWREFQIPNNKSFTLSERVCRYDYNALPWGFYVVSWWGGLYFDKKDRVVGIGFGKHFE